MIRIAINGYGRIGRNVVRALFEENYTNRVEIVAINDLCDVNTNAHLTQYDTTHGKFNGTVSVDNDCLVVNNTRIKVFAERDPNNLPWKALNVDVVLECSGKFASKEKAAAHLAAGAKKVLVSAPCTNADATIVYGVNHNTLNSDHMVVSNASCTTNCLAPIAKVLNDHVGIESGLMTTIHSYTNDQVLVDTFHTDLRRARAAAQSMIPTKTGAASAVGEVLPELKGRLDGFAVRVPTINVSLVDLSFISKRATNVKEINQLLKTASENELKGILAYNDQPLVSCDFNHSSPSSYFDATQTKVNGNLVKVLSWYDNEWAFSTRMLDTSLAMMAAK